VALNLNLNSMHIHHYNTRWSYGWIKGRLL